MKFFYFILFSIILFSCSKPTDGDGGNGTDYTPVPQISTISTSVTTYTYPGDPVANTGNAYVNDDPCTKGSGCFLSGKIQTDRYNTEVSVYKPSPTNYAFANQRIIPFTSSIMNYCEVKVPAVGFNDFVDAQYASVTDLMNGVKLTTTDNCFTNNVTPNSPLVFQATYMDPLSADFGLIIPGFAGDYDQKRWFLQSYGAVLLFIEGYWTMRPNADVRLSMPIPASMMAQAPDSVDTWYYANKWERKGVAVKTSNGYSAKIDKPGLWNFAARVNGLYMTMKVRTDNDIPVINAGIRIKQNNNVVSAGRTDADGNMLCFVPARADLMMDLTSNFYNTYGATPSFSRPLGSFQSAGDIPITLPTNSPWLTTYRGTVKACDGSTLQDGVVEIRNPAGFVYAHAPVRNGKYGAAICIDQRRISVFKASSPAEPGRDSAIAFNAGIENEVNLTTCSQNTGLYLHYSVDGVNTSIVGDWSYSNSPFLNGYQTFNKTMIAATHNNTGIQYETGISSITGTFPGAGITGLFVNGVTRNRDLSKPCIVTFSRYDLIPNGYIEGGLDTYYKEGTVSRHLIANFRVKRVL